MSDSSKTSPDRMKGLRPSVIEAVLRTLVIVQHATGTMAPWVPNREQLQMLRDLWEHPLAFFLKVRQIGSTTLIIAWGLLMVYANDVCGQRFNAAFVIDTDAKALERFNLACDFANQMGLRFEMNARCPYSLTFPNGSRFVFMSGGGRRVGASGSYNLLILSELPFWRDPASSISSLMQTLLGGGRVVIETTMGVEDMTARELWLAKNNYFKRFFPFEFHEEYRREYDPEILTPDLEEKLRKEGFTDRESMTEWVWRLQNLNGGDWTKHMREYPQRPEQSWLMALGRWVNATPQIVDGKRISIPTNTSGMALQVFVEPAKTSGHLVLACDPGGGLGRDASAVAVVDRRTQGIVGWVYTNEAPLDDMATALEFTLRYYTTTYVSPTTGSARVLRPVCLIETNGLGRGLHQMAASRGLRPVEVYTDRASKSECMTLSKRMIEAGLAYGPKSLADECDSCHTADGDFRGSKDGLMALGMCYAWMAKNELPADAPAPTRRFEV